MIGGDQLDLLAQHFAAKILDSHLGGLDGIFAAIIGIDAGLIVQNADLDALRRSRLASKRSPIATAAKNADFIDCFPRFY